MDIKEALEVLKRLRMIMEVSTFNTETAKAIDTVVNYVVTADKELNTIHRCLTDLYDDKNHKRIKECLNEIGEIHRDKSSNEKGEATE